MSLDRSLLRVVFALLLPLLGGVGCQATYAEANGEVGSILGFDADGAEPAEYRVRQRVRRLSRFSRFVRGMGLLAPMQLCGIGDPILVDSDNPRKILRRALRRSSETMGSDLGQIVEVYLHASYVLDRDDSTIDRFYAMSALQRVLVALEGDLMAVGVIERTTVEAEHDYRAYRTLEQYRVGSGERPLEPAEERLFRRAIHRLSRRPRSGLNAATGGRRIVRTLYDAYRDETRPELRSLLATAVADAIVVQTFEDLRTQAILGSDPRTQQEACRTLRRLAGPRIVPRILSWMGDGNGGLRSLGPAMRQLVIDLCASARDDLLWIRFGRGPNAAEALRLLAADESDPDLKAYAESALARALGTPIGNRESWVSRLRDGSDMSDRDPWQGSVDRIRFQEVSW